MSASAFGSGTGRNGKTRTEGACPMRTRTLAILAATLTLAARAEAAGPPQTDDQKTIYALGLALSRNLATFNLTPEELEFVEMGLSDGVQGKKPVVTLEEYGPKIQELQKGRLSAAAA